VVLTGVSSERFGAIEIHTMESVDGKMRMRRLERIEIGCEQDTALSPGGKHLMLFRAVGRPERGARIPMRLEFEDGSAQTVEFEVRQR
jgi:copper(I)-binding protein